MKLGTFFSGIGAVEKALKNIGVDYELQFFSEIDKYAIKSYIEIHNEPVEKNIGDISKLKGKDLPYCDMWFGGFPCQDISIAGNLAGWESNTRSSLGWEMIRLAREVEEKPKYIIFENVKNITSKRFKNTLRLFKSDLEELGYTLHDKVLNAKDYGIPQNRERYFLIASLEDIDYKFPKKEELKLTLKDMLESEVDEKFYLKEEQIERMLTTTYNSGKYETRVQKEIANTLLARDYKDPKLITENYIEWEEPGKLDIDCRAFKEEKVMSTIMTTPKNKVGLKIPEATKKGYAIAHDGDGVYINRPHQKRGVVQKDKIQTLKTSGDDVGVVVGTYQHSKSDKFMQGKSRLQLGKETSDTLQTTPKKGIAYSNLRIRKLTPKECFRLMGFDDEDFEKTQTVNSNTQLYKQAGNSIVVRVLEKILVNLLKGE